MTRSDKVEKRAGAAASFTKKRPMNLADIAAVAGVSSATVSRVLNDSGYVAAETRAAVEKAVAQVGYVVNGAARALASRRTSTIGALTPSFANAISSQTIDAFQSALDNAGYVLLLAGCDYDLTRAHKSAEAMVSRGIDAMFIISLQSDERLYAMLRNQRTPFLTTLPNDNPLDVPFVGYDHRAAGRRSVEFLLDLGHRDFGIISTPFSGSLRLRERVATMKQSIEAKGGILREGMTTEVATSTLASGRDALRRMQSRSSLPSAIIATNDTLAAGVVMECIRQGIRIPEDLSVMGYGDMDMAEHMTPAITTIRTPKREIGETAAKFILSHVSDGNLPSRKLDFDLVVRETTSRLKS